MAATATSTATPSPRRTHSPAPSERFIAGEHAPADEKRQRQRGRRARRIGEQQERRLHVGALQRGAGQDQAEHGPAHGAQSRPVAMPSNERRQRCPPSAAALPSADCDSRAPSATSGRVSRSASCGNSSVRPKTASSTIASEPAVLVGLRRPSRRPPRPGWRRRRRSTAMPTSSGSPLRTNGRSARANTNGQHRQDARAEDGQHAAEVGRAQRGSSIGSGAQADKRLERHGHAVHAVAQAGRLRAVIEDVAEMAAAAAAMHGRAHHAERRVARLCRRRCPAAPRSSASRCRCRTSSSTRTGRDRSRRRRSCPRRCSCQQRAA